MDYDPFFVNMIPAHVSENKEGNLLKMIENFEGPDEVFTHVKILKDEENLLFKKGNIQVARGIYKQATKLISYVLPTGMGNKNALRV